MRYISFFFLQTTARRVHRYGATVPSSVSFSPLSFSLFLSLSSSLPRISPCSPFGIARTFTSLLSLLPHSPFSLSLFSLPLSFPLLPLSPSSLSLPSFSSPPSAPLSLSFSLPVSLARRRTREGQLSSADQDKIAANQRDAPRRVLPYYTSARTIQGPSSGDTCARANCDRVAPPLSFLRFVPTLRREGRTSSSESQTR